MKKLIVLILLTTSLLAAQAQEGLHTSALFEGRVIPQQRMVETRVRGRSLSKYGLTYFRSVRFEASKKEREQVIELVKQDMEGLPATDYQYVRKTWDDQIYLQLPPAGNRRRMLCYKYDGEYVLVIYMEGPKASLEVLKKMSN